MGLLPSAQTACFTYIRSPLQKSVMESWVGWDLWKLPSPNSLLKPCPVNLVNQSHPAEFGDSVEKEIAWPLQAPIQCLITFLCT